MKTEPISVNGYLTESKLSEALQQLLPNCWLGTQVRMSDRRHRWDMSYETDGQITVVEYDGDEHYRNSMKIKADRAKDEIARNRGYRVVRFPYWVQLDGSTLEHYFGLRAQVIQTFPHGFITTRLFPASFCELGIERFRAELLATPISIREAVLLSLRDRAAEHGLQYVLSASLADIIAAK